jgi:holin-like protein
LVLVAFQWLGELGVWLTGLAIPGPLLGMLLLLTALSFSDEPVAFLDKTSNLLIQNLSLIFIPISVGAFFLSHDIYQQFPSILTLIVLSTSGVIIFMALLIRRLVQDV